MFNPWKKFKSWLKEGEFDVEAYEKRISVIKKRKEQRAKWEEEHLKMQAEREMIRRINAARREEAIVRKSNFGLTI